MKYWQKLGLSLLTVACLGTIAPRPAQANMFTQTEVDQSRYVVMAVPLARGGYRLLVVEQMKDTRPCWRESGSNPVVIDPLLTTFDFTGICGRATDSNGYSIRVAQQDLGLQYSLRIEQRDGELLLVGSSNRGGPRMVIGRTHGIQEGQFLKFHLEPTWRLTRRTYEGQVLGHVYFTNDTWEAATGSAPTPVSPVGTETNIPPATTPQS
ncbi:MULTISPECIES: DUF3747 domain-containing protein [unclassified Thermosynechococcus]|jgi:hypothetical protein|uniref:DUF3747 domain-containing protein n=1 Tax=unclassified Thermosynechococcus TaxID=2622553 RepID=UPI000F24C633|nr:MULTISPECIES: DUF3747 domain-containing protein [unclassified Thermosynechococcus]RMH67591.1 MAG: DUF3747 domain-containing protein [Cyanobacteria bacterium J003]HIK23501.1 DUF3747 domain-containing protein [Thermosynechococcus sp. M3746_W2019_013]